MVVKSPEKLASLLFVMQEHILQKNPKDQTIIFAATRHHVEYLYEMTRLAGLKTTYIYGAMDQFTREDRLMKFRQKKIDFLIVTDLAARGIDIPLLQNVINYDFPPNLKLFIHRAGRTARAGQKGTSYTFVTPDEIAYLHDVSVYVGKSFGDSAEYLNNQLQERSQAPEKADTKDLMEDPKYITFGKIPQTIIDEYSQFSASIYSKNPELIKPLADSMRRSVQKYNKTREEASTAGLEKLNKTIPKIHPLLMDKVDEKEEVLMKFRESLKNYKPRQTCLEIGMIKAKDEGSLKMLN
mmetsp:Transcript_41812/g.63890  ORF Transcript_41812/g.63890 Transcript_41812/m.63890 type:complete len:296 (+) Transcript_41812:795-1682(+)